MKCKICGGLLEPLPNGDFRCDSCGNLVTAVSLEEKKRAGINDSLQAAEQLREKGDFDSAYLLYENLLTKRPEDADCRWKLVLCRYGIIYQFDELTGEDLPTVNRMRYDSILADPDYLAALEHANSKERKEYEHSARVIADIQKRYLAIAEKEQPYDVFISFKAENADGTRSRDSVIGQEIYNHLTEHGLRVFYSRITLENKGGEEFEPYIFSALRSAKVMLLIGTDREHLLAPWVANEWRRYLKLMQEEGGKSLIPVYEGMELSDFPEGIPTREAADYSVQGALQELTQGVLSLTGKGVIVEARDSHASIARLTEGMRQAAEQGEFGRLRELVNAVLDINAENSDAYYYLLLAQFKVKKATALSDIDEDWPESRYYQRALKYADPARRQMLEAVRTRRDMRLEDERKNRAERVERERRERELEKALDSAKRKLDGKDYQGAFDILSKEAAGSPEAAGLLEISKKGIEAKRLLAREKPLMDIIKQEHPAEYFKWEKLSVAYERYGGGIGIKLDLMYAAAGVGLFFLGVLAGTGNMSELRKSENILAYLWMFLGPILMVVLLLASLIIIAVSLFHLVKDVYGAFVGKVYKKYMDTVINPMKEAAWERIRSEYAPWLGEEMFRQMPQ